MSKETANFRPGLSVKRERKSEEQGILVEELFCKYHHGTDDQDLEWSVAVGLSTAHPDRLASRERSGSSCNQEIVPELYYLYGKGKKRGGRNLHVIPIEGKVMYC